MNIRLALAALAISTTLAGAIYLIRATQAEQASTPPSQIAPQVEGRLVSLISGEGLDGVGFKVLCEFDAWVKIKNGVVDQVLDGPFGNPVTPPPDAPVTPGESAGAVDGSRPPGPGSGLEEGAAFAKVYRDTSGDLREGCAPESVITYDDSKPVPAIAPTPPPR